MNKTSITIFAVVVLLAMPQSASANYNAITVTMQLLDGNGAGTNGVFDVNIKLWTAETGGVQTFSTTQTGIVVENGMMHAMFETNIVTWALITTGTAAQIWIEIQLMAGPDVPAGGYSALPRMPFRGVPYAYRAVRSDGVNSVVASAGDPVSCNGGRRGYVYLNTSGADALRYCTGSEWRNVVSVTSCSNGQLPKWNNGWSCKNDNNTTYSPGSGLKLSGTTFSIKSSGVTGAMIKNNAITNNDFSTNTIESNSIHNDTLNAGHIKDGTITNIDISANAKINLGRISDAAPSSHSHDSTYVNEGQQNSISGDMITNGTIGNADLANNTITGNRIKDGTLTNSDINTDQVQKGIGSNCASGQWAKGFYANGNIICESDGQGPTGAKGDKGNKGDKGDKGDGGDAGAKGDKGDKGDTGPRGNKGDKGDTGNSTKGAKGDKGDKGDGGYQGSNGAKGDKGAKGSKGAKGNKGERGVECFKEEHVRTTSSSWSAGGCAPPTCSKGKRVSGGWKTSHKHLYQGRQWGYNNSGGIAFYNKNGASYTVTCYSICCD